MNLHLSLAIAGAATVALQIITLYIIVRSDND